MLQTARREDSAVEAGHARGKSSGKGANMKAAEDATTWLRDCFSKSNTC